MSGKNNKSANRATRQARTSRIIFIVVGLLVVVTMILQLVVK